MTPRERFLAVARGEQPDRMPYHFGGPRQSTFSAWRQQGLSADQAAAWGSFVGEEGFAGIGKVDFGPLPRFDERVIEETGNTRVWVDHYGVTRVDAIHQPTPGFATRRYLEFPVKSPADFARMRERYDPRTSERLAPVPGENERASVNPDGYRVYQGTTHWRDRVDACNAGEAPVCLTIPGLFWTVRDWCGFEGLSLMCAEQPSLVRQMMDFWAGFVVDLLDEPLRAIRVDLVILNEDMAYKTAAMISPDMMRRFMLPGYERVRAFLRDCGVACVMMDTDGHNGQVAAVFHPDTIDGLTPMEIAANNDPERFLRGYPRLFITGGIDKRELRGTREEVRAEVVRRYGSARRHGRYVPMVAHGVPPDVPLRNFLYMVELLRGFADGADLDAYEPPCRLERELGPVERLFDADEAIRRAQVVE